MGGRWRLQETSEHKGSMAWGRDTARPGSFGHSDYEFLMLPIYPGSESIFCSTVQQLGSWRQMVTFSVKMMMMMMMMMMMTMTTRTATNTASSLLYQALQGCVYEFLIVHAHTHTHTHTMGCIFIFYRWETETPLLYNFLKVWFAYHNIYPLPTHN